MLVYQNSTDSIIKKINTVYNLTEKDNIIDVVTSLRNKRKKMLTKDFIDNTKRCGSALGTLCLIDNLTHILHSDILNLSQLQHQVNVVDFLKFLTNKRTITSQYMKKLYHVVEYLEELEQTSPRYRRTRVYNLLRIIVVSVLSRDILNAGIVAMFMLHQLDLITDRR